MLQHPDYAEQLGRALAARLEHLQPTAILSPALGGIVIGQEVGRAMQIRAIFAERQDGKLTLRRGFTLAKSDRVVVVEDVITTGGSTRETIAVAEASGASVFGAAAIIDRGADPGRLNMPLQALVRMEVPAYPPEACPMCAKGTAGDETRSECSGACREPRHDMRTVKLTVAYDGTDYVGWQRQGKGVSVQGLIEEALTAIEGRRSRCTAPGGPTRACTRSGRWRARG